MVRNALMGAAMIAALTGCSGSAFDNGIYYFFFPNFDNVEFTCDTSVTHNVTGGVDVCPEATDDSEFTTDQTWTAPPTVVAGEIVKYDYEGEEGYTHALVLYNLFGDDLTTTLWGFKDGKTWHFEQLNHEDHTSSLDHNGGDYSFSDDEQVDSNLVVEGEFSGGVFTGTFTFDFIDDYNATETDVWTPSDVGIFNPLLNQLVGDADLCNPGSTPDEPDYFSYSAQDADCSGSDCTLGILQTCSTGAVDVTGRLTSDDGQGIVTAGSPGTITGR